MAPVTLTDTRLTDFLASIKPNGAYAILATQHVGLQWVATQIHDLSGVTVNWGAGKIHWPNLAWAALLSVTSDHDFHRLRGTAWDAALLVFGDPAYPFPDSLHLFLEQIKRVDDFKTFSVTW